MSGEKIPDSKQSPHDAAKEAMEFSKLSWHDQFGYLKKHQKAERLATDFRRRWDLVLAWKKNLPGNVSKKTQQALLQPEIDKLGDNVNMASDQEIWWDALVISLEVLAATGKPIPPPLAELAIRAMRGQSKRPAKRGKPPNVGRDQAIYAAIKNVLRYFPNMTPTQNRAKKETVSACAVVKEVIEEYDCFLTIESVEKIWENQERKRKNPESENNLE